MGGEAADPSGLPVSGHRDFFAESSPVFIEITVATNLFPKLSKRSREYVPASFSVGTTRLDQVGIRLKGISTFQPIQGRPSLAVKFDQFLPGQRMGRLSKLLLNNGGRDLYPFREGLACFLFRDAGLPAARTRHVRLSLNGRNLGVYLAVESMNKDFLRRNFGDDSGNLYEGFMQDINGELELDNGNDASRADLRALRKALAIPDPSVRRREVNSLLDVDRFMAFAVLNLFLGTEDGYLSNGNNYRVYHDPVSRRLVFIPHGLDATFICGRPVNPPLTNAIVMRGLYSLPHGPELYQSNAWRLLTNTWRLATITNRIAESVRELIALSYKESERAHWVEWGEVLCSQVTARRQEILAALSQPHTVQAEFDSEGVALLTNWFPIAHGNSPWFGMATNADRVFLQIEAVRPSAGSWRTRVSVPEGAYSISCRARSKGRMGSVATSYPAARVSLGGGASGAAVVKNGEWEDLSFSFRAPAGGLVAELICEYQSGIGEVMFELPSLRISSRSTP